MWMRGFLERLAADMSEMTVPADTTVIAEHDDVGTYAAPPATAGTMCLASTCGVAVAVGVD